MFNKDIFRLYQCEKFPFVSSLETVNTICIINSSSYEYEGVPFYPHSVITHLLSTICKIIEVSELKELVIKSSNAGWRPYRSGTSLYEQICIKKIVDTINNFERKGGVYNGKTKKRKKSKA